MSDVFISYARSTAKQAQAVAEGLRSLGHAVWLDDELPAHRAYTDVIEERLKAAKAVVVVWSAEAAKSHWVRAEANTALEAGTLVQLTVDGVMPPMPFGQIQCADLNGWSGDPNTGGWRKVAASVADLVGGPAAAAPVGPKPPPLPTKPSLAVMPFANLSGDPEQEYFADGMVEEIATALSHCRSIFVIGASSGLSFKGTETTPQEAARLLGVRYVLEGSVRKAAGRVRITAKLTDATDGAQVFAERFEDTLEDVFALQDRVALGVAGVLEPAVLEADLRRALSRPTEDMGSYDLALRAIARYRSWAKDDVRAGLELLNRAIALDPEYGYALSLAALCRAFEVIYGWSDDPESSVREIRSLIERAAAVSRDNAEVQATLATPALMVGGWAQAAAFAKRALSLNPGSSLAWMACGYTTIVGGDAQLGLEQMRTSLRLDPRSAWEGEIQAWIGIANFALRQFAEAVPPLHQSIQLRPHWALPRAFLAATYGLLGEAFAARQAFAELGAITPADFKNSHVFLKDAGLRDLFVEGIALAEGTSPNDTPTTS